MAAVSKYNLTSSDGTTPQFALGTTVEVKGATYRYFLAGGNISAFDACTVNNSFTAVQGTTTTSGARPTLVCIPQFAVLSGEYFWAPVGPFQLREDGQTAFRVNALTLCAADVKLYTTATAGAVDDTATDLIAGLVLTATNSGGSTAAQPCVAVQTLVTNCQD